MDVDPTSDGLAEALADERCFVDWLGRTFGLQHPFDSGTDVRELVGSDPSAYYGIIATLETAGLSTYDTELVDAIETIGDLYYFARVKGEQADGLLPGPVGQR